MPHFNGSRLRMFSFSRKYDLLHYEICFFLNFVILFTFNFDKNVATAMHQATLNLQDSYSDTDLSTNQLSNANSLNNQLNHQLLNNQSNLDNLSIDTNFVQNKPQNSDQSSHLNQPIILPNFQDQSNLWSLQLDKSIQNSNQNLDYSNPSTLVPTSINQNLNPSVPFINSQTISNSLNSPTHHNSHHNSQSSISSHSNQSPRPSYNENSNNQFNSNHIYNENNYKNSNINHHNINHNLGANQNSNTNNNNNQFNQNSIVHPVNSQFKKMPDINSFNSINHNLFGNHIGNVFPPVLPSNSKLRINTDSSSDMVSFKNKNAFNVRKSLKTNLKDNPLPNFLLTNKRNIQSNNWQQIGTQLNSKLNGFNSNEDVFKTDYPTNKFIPNRMQTDDYEESGEDDGLKNNNVNSNMNGNFPSTQNDSGDEDNFSDAFNSNNDLDHPSPLNTNNESTNKKKNLNSVDPMNLLLYNKLNQQNLEGKTKMMNSNGLQQSNNPNQPYYVILPQLPASNPYDDLFDSAIDSNPPPQHQKRRKSTSKQQGKLSWWHRLLPERLRPQINQQTTSSETSSEENQSDDGMKYKDTKFKNSYLKAPSSENDLFTEVYGTGLQPNLPLPVFQPMSAAQLLQTLPYQQTGYHTGNGNGMLGLPPSASSFGGGSSLFSGIDGEPSEEEAAAEEDAEDEEGHSSSQSPTLADRMKNWWKNIFKSSSSDKEKTNNQHDHNARKAASKLSPKILII